MVGQNKPQNELSTWNLYVVSDLQLWHFMVSETHCIVTLATPPHYAIRNSQSIATSLQWEHVTLHRVIEWLSEIMLCTLNFQVVIFSFHLRLSESTTIISTITPFFYNNAPSLYILSLPSLPSLPMRTKRVLGLKSRNGRSPQKSSPAISPATSTSLLQANTCQVWNN